MADETRKEEQKQKNNITPEEEIFRQRKDKLMRLRREEGYDPYQQDHWEVKHTLPYIKEKYSSLKDEEWSEDEIQTAGRVMVLRRHGKTAFATFEDEHDRMQLCFQFDLLGETDYTFFKKWVDAGDFLGVIGVPFRTQRGELTIAVKKFCLLSKALRPMPEKWHGLKDMEVRYRQRYIDLIANPEVRIRSARDKDNRRSAGSSTPTLTRSPDAHPLDDAGERTRAIYNSSQHARHRHVPEDSTELYLKRLEVGKLGRVYEIGQQFRNEGMDMKHNPEFTSLEVYWPYANYKDMMDLAEEIIVACADELGGRVIDYQGTEIDLNPPFRRATMTELVTEHTGIDFSTITDEEARRQAAIRGLEVKLSDTRYDILPIFFEEYVEEKLIQPTFVLGHPTVISPLSKRNKENPDITDRFELFINAWELANAFSELKTLDRGNASWIGEEERRRRKESSLRRRFVCRSDGLPRRAAWVSV